MHACSSMVELLFHFILSVIHIIFLLDCFLAWFVWVEYINYLLYFSIYFFSVLV